MGLIRDWKIKRRVDRLLNALAHAAENPELYTDPRWQRDTASQAGDVVDLVPLPPPVKERVMGFLKNFDLGKLINLVLTAVISGAAGAAVDVLQHGGTPKVAGSAALAGAGAGVINLFRKSPTA